MTKQVTKTPPRFLFATWLVLVALLLHWHAPAQSGVPAGERDLAGERGPVLAATHPVYGSDMTIRLTGAPMDSSVTYCIGNERGALLETLGPRAVGASGSDVVTLPLLDREWVGRDLQLWAEISTYREVVTTRRLEIEVRNPSLFLSSVGANGEAGIACYDEVERRIVQKAGLGARRPGRVLLSRDGKRGFVRLDSDQIGVFDPREDRWLFWFIATGNGLLDITMTPDGSQVIVLCTERPVAEGSHAERSDWGRRDYIRGTLWIYSIASDGQPQPVTIDPIEPVGPGRILAVSEDSRQVFIRTGKDTLGEYNLKSHAYKRHFLSDQVSHCTIRDMQVYRNCLVALMTDPDDRGYLCLFNIMTYRSDHVVDAGWDPMMFDIFDGENGPVVVLVDSLENGLTERLRFIDLVTGNSLKQIPVCPSGVVDVDVNEIRDIGAVLYVPDGQKSEHGFVGFFDKQNFNLIGRCFTVPVDAGSRIILSHSPLVNSCYVLTSDGILSVIDLARKGEVHVFYLGPNESSQPVVVE